MSKGNAFETSLLNLILNNLAIPNIGDAPGLQPSAVDGVLYLSLHTADPGEGGSQNTSEATYTGYARVSITRDGSGWTVGSGQAQNSNLVSFPICTAGSDTITHVGVGTDLAGAGNLLYSGVLTSPLAVSTGITPQFAATSITITED